MKIFISWSGERSRIIAEGLNEWMPRVIQAIKPIYSPEIEKGTKGIEEINRALEETSFGIICLTPENLKSEWIHYEAGALSKIEGARIWTLLHNLNPSDVVQPLAQFQHTLIKKLDVLKLLSSINEKLEKSLETNVLRDSFEKRWSDFEDFLIIADKAITEKQEKDNPGTENIRKDREVIDEILELLRNQQRQSNIFGGSLDNLTEKTNNSVRKIPLIVATAAAAQKTAEKYIGVDFSVFVEDGQKLRYRNLINTFINEISSVQTYPKVTESQYDFNVRIVFESPFDDFFLSNLKTAALKQFDKESLSEWNPILV